MNGCSTKDFHRKLKWLNPLLRVDDTRILYSDPEYPVCGLYYGDKYLFGVPQIYTPENSIASIDFNFLIKQDRFDVLKEIDTYGFVPKEFAHMEEILWKGSKTILAMLCRLGYIDATKASKEFRFDVVPNRIEFPRNYVHRKAS